MARKVISFIGRTLITGLAFWWIAQKVHLASFLTALQGADWSWVLVGVGFFFLAQFACIARWRLLIPRHPSLNLGFLTNSFFVACFFNTFLPTTIGGDVIRGYDLIKATGQWRESLASILVDRLVGFVGLFFIGLFAWATFPPAREDLILRNSFIGFGLVVFLTLGILGNRRLLQGILKPFGKVGLGQLAVHGKQFQETLLGYGRSPKRLLQAFGVTLGVQTASILMFLCVSKALSMGVPLLFFLLTVPIVALVSQLPISLSGWGVREGATILLFQRIGIEVPQALSLSLICGAIPLTAGAIGGFLFLTRSKRRRA